MLFANIKGYLFLLVAPILGIPILFLSVSEFPKAPRAAYACFIMGMYFIERFYHSLNTDHFNQSLRPKIEQKWKLIYFGDYGHINTASIIYYFLIYFFYSAFYWITEALPLSVTALLPLILFPTLQVATANEVASAYFNDTIILMFG